MIKVCPLPILVPPLCTHLILVFTFIIFYIVPLLRLTYFMLKKFPRTKHQGELFFEDILKMGCILSAYLRTASIYLDQLLLGERVSSSAWHSRLGRLSSTILRDFHFRFNLLHSGLSASSICSSCQLGKSKKLPLSSSSSFTTKPWELIHCDIWGAAPILSISGFKYYIVFIDDYSRYCWSFPLVHRSNVYHVFANFKSLAEDPLDHKIKKILSNGVGELMSAQFLKCPSTDGISYQLSCPHTPNKTKQDGQKESIVI